MCPLACSFLPGCCSIDVLPQHAPPLLLLQAPEVLLQGEQASITVTVAAADGISGATLLSKAVHADSQQQLGLVHAAGGAQQPAQQQPGDTHGGRVCLGELAAGQHRQVALLLDARYQGSVIITVELKVGLLDTRVISQHCLPHECDFEKCAYRYAMANLQFHRILRSPCHPSSSLQYTATSSSGSRPEMAHCTASLAVQVQLPWKLSLQLLGPPATHTLLAGAAGSSSSSGDSPNTRLLEQQQRLHTLSVQDSIAAAAGPPAEAAIRDLSVQLMRSLPPHFLLPAGQQCTAVVQLQSLAACQLDVLAVELEGAAGAAAALSAGGSALLTGEQADTLNKSDIFTAAFPVASSSPAAAELPSLGVLRLRWRRRLRPALLQVAAARGASVLTAADAKAAATQLQAAGPAAAGSSSSGGSSAPPCEALVPLPPVSYLSPLLTAAVTFPPITTAGSPAQLQLLLRNTGADSQVVVVSVKDPHGFLLAGVQLPFLLCNAWRLVCVQWHGLQLRIQPPTRATYCAAAAAAACRPQEHTYAPGSAQQQQRQLAGGALPHRLAQLRSNIALPHTACVSDLRSSRCCFCSQSGLHGCRPAAPAGDHGNLASAWAAGGGDAWLHRLCGASSGAAGGAGVSMVALRYMKRHLPTGSITGRWMACL